jgi:hypothetical protein
LLLTSRCWINVKATFWQNACYPLCLLVTFEVGYQMQYCRVQRFEPNLMNTLYHKFYFGDYQAKVPCLVRAFLNILIRVKKKILGKTHFAGKCYVFMRKTFYLCFRTMTVIHFIISCLLRKLDAIITKINSISVCQSFPNVRNKAEKRRLHFSIANLNLESMLRSWFTTPRVDLCVL